jgi:hypothetical protein
MRVTPFHPVVFRPAARALTVTSSGCSFASASSRRQSASRRICSRCRQCRAWRRIANGRQSKGPGFPAQEILRTLRLSRKRRSPPGSPPVAPPCHPALRGSSPRESGSPGPISGIPNPGDRSRLAEVGTRVPINCSATHLVSSGESEKWYLHNPCTTCFFKGPTGGC